MKTIEPFNEEAERDG